MIRADRLLWISTFTGPSEQQFRTLVGVVADRGADQFGVGRRSGLPSADRVLVVAVYYRTDLALRQTAPVFRVSRSAAGRVVDHLAGAPTLLFRAVQAAEGEHARYLP